MKGNYTVSSRIRNLAIMLGFIGLVTIGLGLWFSPERTWSNFLLNNYYFISIAIGATFFLAIQYITQSGWSAQFVRIPHAIGTALPVFGILILLVFFGRHALYPWTIPDNVENNALIAHKTPYLNTSFFMVRLAFFVALWTIMTYALKKMSLREDVIGGLSMFIKSEFYSKVYIFILAITFSFATFDLIMSIDVKWFSTMFAVKNFVAAFYHSVAIIILIILLLNRKRLFLVFNDSHLHDFSKYLFILSIIWSYLWFIEFLLMWFANLPEETIYFVSRMTPEWRPYFYLTIVLNGALPFLLLLSNKMDTNKTVVTIVCIILVLGQWVDLFLQIMPGTTGKAGIGLIEIGMFIGFGGLFGLLVIQALAKIPLIPFNHPYLNESINH